MRFPQYRVRRARSKANIRRMIQETRLSVADLIYPLFAIDGQGVGEEVPSMPGVYHLPLDRLKDEVEEVLSLNIPAVLLFGVPDPVKKDEQGSEAYNKEGIAQRAVRAIREVSEDLVVITDVCLCGYTSHGHCGLVREGQVLNDETIELLSKIAVSYAEAGADVVAPSAMMDGMVRAIRSALDEHGFADVAIMSYAAKYSSGFYGPFREAAHSAPQFGNRQSYQMNPANAEEALREVALDIEEGADIIMVKPALAYMDIIRLIKEHFKHPLAAYNVSGEYAMVKAVAAKGWIDERTVVLEILTGIRRAGADLIITYHAKEVAQWLLD